jgi:hypothetical protein
VNEAQVACQSACERGLAAGRESHGDDDGRSAEATAIRPRQVEVPVGIALDDCTLLCRQVRLIQAEAQNLPANVGPITFVEVKQFT